MFERYYMILFNEYLHKQFKEKFGTLLIFFVLMLSPGLSIKMFGVFFTILFGLLSDAKNRRLDLLTFLPYTRSMIYWFGFGFLVTIVLLTSLVGLPFYDSLSHFFTDLGSSLIFLSSYFGLSFILINFLSVDPYGSLFLILISDAILSSLGYSSVGHFYNPYRLVSPLWQGNIFAAAVFAIVCLYLGYLSVVKKGGE